MPHYRVDLDKTVTFAPSFFVRNAHAISAMVSHQCSNGLANSIRIWSSPPPDPGLRHSVDQLRRQQREHEGTGICDPFSLRQWTAADCHNRSRRIHMIKMICVTCGGELDAPNKMAGQECMCSLCGARQFVPGTPRRTGKATILGRIAALPMGVILFCALFLSLGGLAIPFI